MFCQEKPEMYIVRSTNPEEVVVSLSQASDHLGYTDKNI